jgi:hypothetical protein
LIGDIEDRDGKLLAGWQIGFGFWRNGHSFIDLSPATVDFIGQYIFYLNRLSQGFDSMATSLAGPLS